tara:strand:- start:202 stop:489 length:288 start_codon:yes stop_codon:yes gene_type:complete
MNLQENIQSKSSRNGNINCDIINKLISNCEEIFYIYDCENFLDENELNIKDFNENDLIIFSNICNDFNNVIKMLNDNKISYKVHEDLLDLKNIII